MKDKIQSLGIEGEAPSTVTINSEVQNEAVNALTTLGFPQAASVKIVQAILKESPELSVEKVIKMALKML